MDIYDIRRSNLRKLMAQWGGPTSLAAKLGHSNGSYIAQLVGPHPSREISEKVARGIEAKLGLPFAYLDGHLGNKAAVDEPLLAKCIRAVAAALEDAGSRPGHERFGELVALAYDQAAGTGACDETYINRLVRLLK
jgi:hypothetical protein